MRAGGRCDVQIVRLSCLWRVARRAAWFLPAVFFLPLTTSPRLPLAARTVVTPISSYFVISVSSKCTSFLAAAHPF